MSKSRRNAPIEHPAPSHRAALASAAVALPTAARVAGVRGRACFAVRAARPRSLTPYPRAAFATPRILVCACYGCPCRPPAPAAVVADTYAAAAAAAAAAAPTSRTAALTTTANAATAAPAAAAAPPPAAAAISILWLCSTARVRGSACDSQHSFSTSRRSALRSPRSRPRPRRLQTRWAASPSQRPSGAARRTRRRPNA